MHTIHLLEQETIDKIAAGEVIERPASIVKELVENSIDAGANAVTVEIKDGGISFIRITDNGEGIEKDQISTAFLRHATSKIRCVEDLLEIGSLGFRGEALSSIAAVCQVELITKTPGSLTGVRYLIEGGKEKGVEEIGAPEGSTFLVRNIFYNTPARKKFLKTAATEAGYISDLMERLALSNPNVSVQFINNGQVKLHTSGNGNVRDIIYHVFGRDINSNLITVERSLNSMKLTGMIGKPVISRGNRNFENYFINGRYVKSSIIAKAIEDSYKTFMMQHRYPFTVLFLQMDGHQLDVNVHPTKMDLRFANQAELYQFIFDTLHDGLTQKELIPRVSVGKTEDAQASLVPKLGAVRRSSQGPDLKTVLSSPDRELTLSEKMRLGGQESAQRLKVKQTEKTEPQTDSTQHIQPADGLKQQENSGAQPADGLKQQENSSAQSADGLKQQENSSTRPADELKHHADSMQNAGPAKPAEQMNEKHSMHAEETPKVQPAGEPENDRPGSRSYAEPFEKNRLKKERELLAEQSGAYLVQGEQMDLFDGKLLARESVQEHKLIGQVFDTYWIVEYRSQMYIIDQHAAHEKVMYERLNKALETKQFTTQRISPPIIISLSMQEENLLKQYRDVFCSVGFEIEHFGGKEYSICGVPDNLFGFTERQLFIDMLDSLSETTGKPSADFLNEKLASMACKRAVKGNSRMSTTEANALIGELLSLKNPYNCPHGRPTIVAMSKYELEKKFKRIV